MLVRTSRRNLLIAAGGSALALPMFEASTPKKAQAAFENARQVLFYYTPNGSPEQKKFFPQGGSATEFKLGKVLAPLERHKSEMLILENLDSRAAIDGKGDPHAVGFATMLSGARPLSGSEFQHGACAGKSSCTGTGWGGGASVDQIIGQAQKASIPNHPYASFNFSVKRAAASLYTRMSYTKPGQDGTVNPESNPQAAFEAIFAGAMMAPAGAGDAAKARLYLKNKSVLDELSGEFDQLLPKLSTLDRAKLQQHQQSIRTVEKTLMGVSVAGSCAAAPTRPNVAGAVEVTRGADGMEDKDPNAHNDIEARQDAFMQMAVIGMACGMTRVASLLTAFSRADTYLPFLKLDGKSINVSHHSISHGTSGSFGKGNVVPLLEVINAWYASKLAEFWDLMKTTMGPEGKMLSETSSIFWHNEIARGNHTHNNKPHLLLGSMGGYFKQGYHYKAPKGTPHNMILTALAKGAGVEVDHVGDDKYKNYDIGDITA